MKRLVTNLGALARRRVYCLGATALRKNRLDVVAIHHHMTDTVPTIFSLHYWGTGEANKLASGFRAALDQLGTPRTTPAQR